MGPRREAPEEPHLPAEVSATELDRSARAQLRSLSKTNAEVVGRHLVMACRLKDSDALAAYAHAMAAARRAGRIALVREMVGITAYHAGLWAQALSELRAARRMSGSTHLIALMAGAERSLGRPERALELAGSVDVSALSRSERIALAIVVSGARRDLGQVEAAVLALQVPELTQQQTDADTSRLTYAYAEALLAAGRRSEALTWFTRAREGDHEQVTDAAARLADVQREEHHDLLEPAPKRPST